MPPPCIYGECPLLDVDPMQREELTHWVKSALRIGVFIDSFRQIYTLMQKRLKVIVSTDNPMVKCRKFATKEMSN